MRSTMALFGFGALMFCLFASVGAQNSPNDYLKPHNDARTKIGVAPLTWDTNLANYAQNYANKRASGDCRRFELSGGPYGENTFWGWGKKYSAADAVASWVSQKQFYNYKSNTCMAGKFCLAYKQVVWRKSVKLGCGQAKCKNGDYFFVCSYNPSGNTFANRPY